MPVLSLELDVENFLEPTPLTHRETGDSPSKVKLSYWQDRA